jgi:hypothetical protein
MARNLREVIAAVSAERRAKVVAAYRQKLIAVKKNRQLEEAKHFMELDHKLIVGCKIACPKCADIDVNQEQNAHQLRQLGDIRRNPLRLILDGNFAAD